MSSRVWIALGLAAAVGALAGCVVVPEPGYGHGPYGHPGTVVRVAPPPVVVVPGRRHYGHHHHDRRPHWRERRGWR
jgi:hypothetical protein